MESTNRPPAGVLQARTLEVETPERVAIGYEIAGLGSRFTALLLDGLIVTGGLIVLLFATLLVTTIAPGGVVAAVSAVIVLAAFLWGWGYFVYLEGRRDGQTIGKRKMGIRVVHEGGYPLSMRGAVIRNLIRIVDAQPGISWLLGGAVMLVDPRTRRLGDLAAGTVVVAERHADRLPEEVPSAHSAVGAPRLADAAFAALNRYVERRPVLEGEARETVATRLAAPLEGLIPREAGQAADEYLVALHRDEQARRQAAGLGGEAGSAQATALVRRQRARWDEYRSLLEAFATGAKRPAGGDVSRFAALYREVAADLARARTYGGSPSLIYTLERLVGAGHNLLYRPTEGSWQSLVRFLTTGFPALVRRRWQPIALAAVLFFGPSFVLFGVIQGDPEIARQVVAPEMIARAESAAERQAEGRGYADVPSLAMPMFASRIITNNIQVTFIAFAGGVLAGLGTISVLILNGLMLGGVAAVFAYQEANLFFWSFVLPHGVIELTAIVIAGGAGLLLGSALVLPGRRTRREALVRRGRDAVSLIVGTAMLLVLAGLVEGFISPSQLPAGVKLGLATLFAVTLAAYLLTGGTSPRPAAKASAP